MDELVDLLEECLHVLNLIPNKTYYYNEKKTTTYDLASRIEKIGEKKEDE